MIPLEYVWSILAFLSHYDRIKQTFLVRELNNFHLLCILCRPLRIFGYMTIIIEIEAFSRKRRFLLASTSTAIGLI